jgi:hypothetical protein
MNGKFIQGVAILGKYLDPNGFDIAANRDLFFMGGEDLPLTPEDRQALLDLDWYIEEESWTCLL